jgi:lipopolysaccharide transport system permease protein
MEKNIIVYEPNDRVNSSFFRTWKVMFSNIINFRELILQLFVRDFLGSFKKSIFGMGWLFVSPIVSIVSWVFMNATGILEPGDVGVPYPVYILFGTSCWNFFMGTYSASAGTLAAGGSIILQVKYPHEVLLIKQIAQFLAGYVISFTANILVFTLFGIIPHWQILIFPILVIPLLLLGSAIGLLMSVLNVVSNDVGHIVNLVLGWSLYLTPIIYSSKIDNPLLQEVIRWNPLTHLIGGVRDLVLFGRLDSPIGFLLSSLMALLAFLLSWRLFHISEQRVIEKIL